MLDDRWRECDNCRALTHWKDQHEVFDQLGPLYVCGKCKDKMSLKATLPVYPPLRGTPPANGPTRTVYRPNGLRREFDGHKSGTKHK